MEVVKELYCICGQPYDEKRFMIQCDNCREWYHGSCVGVFEYVSNDLDKYHCPQCEVTCGPPLFKKQNNWHRHNYTDTDADNKPVQTGTPVFIQELKTRHFPSADPVVTRLKGHQLTLNYLHQNGFDQPIIVEDKEGLDIRVPSEYFTVQDVEALVGSDREVDVIDVARQTDIQMRVCDFVTYFNNPMRARVLNLISLEFSNTKLSELVEAPLVARKLDWVNTVWPLSTGTLPTVSKRPEVQKYCLIGVKDSYTDFHIDFGGTSVWYHVLRGEKIFYLIKPTLANLSLYQRWMTSTTQNETFFGDQVDCCYRCIVQAGHTMMIPTGWIHAVLTPVDTLVFGGNFLHSLNIPGQLQIYEIEKKIRTPERFRFPAFETINWYAATWLCEQLKRLNEESSKVPNYLLLGVKALLFTLKQWSQDRDTNKSRKEEIPSIIDGPKLLKDLSKEIRHAERFLNSLNPPKPERESKRKKKKPVNKDFVDYSQPQHSIILDQMEGENVQVSKKKCKNRVGRRSLKFEDGHCEVYVDQTSEPITVTAACPLPEPPINISFNKLKRPMVRPEKKSKQSKILSLPKPLLYPYENACGQVRAEDESASLILNYPDSSKTLFEPDQTVENYQHLKIKCCKNLPKKKVKVKGTHYGSVGIKHFLSELKDSLPKLLENHFSLICKPVITNELIPQSENNIISQSLLNSTDKAPNVKFQEASISQSSFEESENNGVTYSSTKIVHSNELIISEVHSNFSNECQLKILTQNENQSQVVLSCDETIPDFSSDDSVELLKVISSDDALELENKSNPDYHPNNNVSDGEVQLLRTSNQNGAVPVISSVFSVSSPEDKSNPEYHPNNNISDEIVWLCDETMPDVLSDDSLESLKVIASDDAPELEDKLSPEYHPNNNVSGGEVQLLRTSNQNGAVPVISSVFSRSSPEDKSNPEYHPNNNISDEIVWLCDETMPDVLSDDSLESLKVIASDDAPELEDKLSPEYHPNNNVSGGEVQLLRTSNQNGAVPVISSVFSRSSPEDKSNPEYHPNNNISDEIVWLCDETMPDVLSDDSLEPLKVIASDDAPELEDKLSPEYHPNNNVSGGEVQLLRTSNQNGAVPVISSVFSRSSPEDKSNPEYHPNINISDEIAWLCDETMPDFLSDDSLEPLKVIASDDAPELEDKMSPECHPNNNVSGGEVQLLRTSNQNGAVPVISSVFSLSSPDENAPTQEELDILLGNEPKEPIKLNMKMLSKKIQLKEDSVVRPPLKLTLPKPVTYPYTTPLSENKLKKEDSGEQQGAENKSWFIAMDHSSHVKMRTENNGLKVKLAKQAELPFINLPPNPPVHQSFQDDLLDQKQQTESVYDFHDDDDIPDDDDDNCLTIDESPKKRRWSKGAAPVEQSPASLKAKWAQANHSQIHLNNLLMNLKGIKPEDLHSVDVTSDLPKNGIDELLKASGYTRDESPRIEDLETGRTSPSTREAIAGMLSISRMYMGVEGEGSSGTNSSPRAKKRKHHTLHIEEVEDIDKVHQDDDFIYPSLDLSDDEEERTTRGGKRKIDEAWNPKARVGHVAPKTDRPCREGAKKQSVEKGLEAAAAKRAGLPSPKRPYHRKKPKFVPLALEQPSSSHSSLLPSHAIRPVTIDLKNRKPKKGMATAKQRLGKILKIHKMYH